ncbi:hypothetical protein, conserved [Eimeria brunetti]|uniref:Uncharacterized protein n=1 Tax=Eimeria brunetti TaxID=51314 RepID=U6LRF2_9EIME|nr:hypothetical protein, conserved [Eimeria brunetti]
MVALTRRTVALLAIAACATSALAAEGPAEENVQVVSEVADGQAPAEAPVAVKRSPSPALMAGAGIGLALSVAVALFGLRVLSAKMVQTEAKDAGKKLAEEFMLGTEKLTLSTEAYTAFVTITYEGSASETVKGYKDEDKANEADVLAAEVQALMSTFQKDGVHNFSVPIGDGKISVSLDMKLTAALDSPATAGDEQPDDPTDLS